MALLKQTLGEAAPPAFLFCLKSFCVKNAPAVSTMATPVHPPLSVAVTVKVGNKIVVPQAGLSVARGTTYAQLCTERLDTLQNTAERERFGGLPLTVACFPNHNHMHAHMSTAEVSDIVDTQADLKCNHIVLLLTPPPPSTTSARSAPKVDAIQLVLNARNNGVLPNKYTASPPNVLTFERILYNAIIDKCASDELSVPPEEKSTCNTLILALRDAVQMMEGRTETFNYARVPERFKNFGTKRKKSPAVKICTTHVVEVCVSKLEGALGCFSFMHSHMWEKFRADVRILLDVLKKRLEDMKQRAARMSTSRAAQSKPHDAKLATVTIEPCADGTPHKYAWLEAELSTKEDYEVVQITKDKIREHSPPSAGAETKPALRMHFMRFREGLQFHKFAVKRIIATNVRLV